MDNTSKGELMNGNRLQEHRKPRVSTIHWLLLVGVITAIVAAFSPWSTAKGQEYETYNEGTGLIVQQAEICFSPDLSAESIKLLGTWQRLVNELEAYERGGSVMGEEDALLGQLLHDNHVCATVADFYHVVVVRRVEGYALLLYDEQYGFDEGTFIARAQDVLPDRGI
jgi:hypothetical protein